MENQKKERRIHPILAPVLVTLCLLGGCYGLVLKDVFNILETDHRIYKQRDCDIALLPELSGFVGRTGSKDGYNVYETRKYKNAEELCKALPEGYGDAIRYALDKGSYMETMDLKNASVKSYEITEGLPFVSAEETYEGYAKAIKLATKHLNVLEYKNGKVCLQLMINVPNEAFQPERTPEKNVSFYVFQYKGSSYYLPEMTYIHQSLPVGDGCFAKISADVEWVEGYQIHWNHDYIEKVKKRPDKVKVINVVPVTVEQVYTALCINCQEDVKGLHSLKGYTDEGDYFMGLDFFQDPVYILYQANEKKYIYDDAWYVTEFGTVCYKGTPDKTAVLRKIKDTGILCCEEYFVVPKKEDGSATK